MKSRPCRSPWIPLISHARVGAHHAGSPPRRRPAHQSERRLSVEPRARRMRLFDLQLQLPAQFAGGQRVQRLARRLVRRPAGQEARVVLGGDGPHHHAESVLRLAHPTAEHRIDAQPVVAAPAVGRAQPRAVQRVDVAPSDDELAQPHRALQDVAQPVAQHRRRAPRDEGSRVVQPPLLVEPAEAARVARHRPGAGQGGQIGAEPVVGWPVGLGGGLGVGPGAVEELQHPVGQHVQPAAEWAVLAHPPLVEGVFGEVDGQGAHRPGQPQKQAAHSAAPRPGRLDPLHRGRREGEDGRLRKIDHVLRGQA